MKKILVLSGLFLAGVTALSMGWDGRAPLAKAQATMRVVDQNGEPVSNAIIDGGFADYRTPSIEQGTPFSAQTDTNGCAVLNGKTSGEFTYRVRKEGYYNTGGEYKEWMKLWRPPASNIKDGRWQPWNPTIEVKLKEIKNPIPMFVKSVRTDIPVEDKPIGFDLKIGDWVAPYGEGQKSDLKILLERGARSENNFECSLQVTFSNEGDGLQEYVASPVTMGSLKLPYSAPQTGYISSWKREVYSKPDGSRKNLETRKDQNYVFRVQTVLDENNEVRSAIYGKISGDINFYGYIAAKVKLVFTYYLNPTSNDQNIEFDPDKNLFGGRKRFAP